MTEMLPIIGRSTLASIGGITEVPAKVDTGADLSSVWATDIHEAADGLHFRLFDDSSSYYTGEELVARPDQYHRVQIASSNGTRQKRYAVDMAIVVAGQTITASFSLAERRTLSYPVLLGCNFLAGRFLVDCAQQIPAEMHQTLIDTKQARRRAAA